MNADNNNKIHNPWPLYIGEFFNNENTLGIFSTGTAASSIICGILNSLLIDFKL